jgi:ADP-ribose pyrophosphatase
MNRRFDDSDVEIIEQRRVHNGFAHLDVLTLRHRLHEGGWNKPFERELYDRGHAVAVLPYDPVADRIVLVRQFRIGAYAADFPPWQREAIAGMLKPGEAPEEVARREALEEANLEIGALEPIAHYLSSPGASSESVTLFCGRADVRGAGGIHGLRDENEDIAIDTFAVADIPALLADRAASNGLTLIALQWLLLNRDRLRRVWTSGDFTR